MIAGQNCSTCVAYNALNNECRRKAPTAVLIPGPSGSPVSLGIYPATRKDGWCLEYLATPPASPISEG